jgi:hypothetical protein
MGSKGPTVQLGESGLYHAQMPHSIFVVQLGRLKCLPLLCPLPTLDYQDRNPHSLEVKLPPLLITFLTTLSTPRPAPITPVLRTRRPPNEERVLNGDNSVVTCISVRSRICLCSYFGRRTV